MAYVVSKDAVDSPSTNLCCIYAPQKLDVETTESKNVYFEGKKVEYVKNNSKCSDVPCLRTPVPGPTDTPPGPCTRPLTDPLKRIVVCAVNKAVRINGDLFAVQGDLAQGGSTNRPIQGPFKYLSIHIANKPV